MNTFFFLFLFVDFVSLRVIPRRSVSGGAVPEVWAGRWWTGGAGWVRLPVGRTLGFLEGRSGWAGLGGWPAGDLAGRPPPLHE